jgi:membrane protein insertase Oxa1/YidC/SpoIIIJ
LVEVDHGLSSGGALWFVDLTAPDPYLRLPIAAALLMLANVEAAQECIFDVNVLAYSIPTLSFLSA